jgi:RNA polymerase sigma factor (sigma-70 family)
MVGDRKVSGAQGASSTTQNRPIAEHADIIELAPIVRRVVAARLHDSHSVDDVVQETLVRVMAARRRLDAAALVPYAIVTARNLIAGSWRPTERGRRHEHQLIDLRQPAAPEDEMLQRESADAMAAALAELTARERDAILAHEVEDVDTSALAVEWGSSPGAIAAQLNRARAKLRVEYLLAADGESPPTPQCRPVLLALSSGDSRRQAETDAGHHLLDCSYCGEVSGPLFERRARTTPNEVRVVVEADKDVVTARQRGREIAARAPLSTSDLTMISTAISELARNIVRFARRGEIVVSLIGDEDPVGVRIVASDVGPGIPDVEHALQDGFTTYGGLGLGLGGCQRLMDEFAINSEVGRGTTVTTTKWCKQ